MDVKNNNTKKAKLNNMNKSRQNHQNLYTCKSAFPLIIKSAEKIPINPIDINRKRSQIPQSVILITSQNLLGYKKDRLHCYWDIEKYKNNLKLEISRPVTIQPKYDFQEFLFWESARHNSNKEELNIGEPNFLRKKDNSKKDLINFNSLVGNFNKYKVQNILPMKLTSQKENRRKLNCHTISNSRYISNLNNFLDFKDFKNFKNLKNFKNENNFCNNNKKNPNKNQINSNSNNMKKKSNINYCSSVLNSNELSDKFLDKINDKEKEKEKGKDIKDHYSEYLEFSEFSESKPKTKFKKNLEDNKLEELKTFMKPPRINPISHLSKRSNDIILDDFNIDKKNNYSFNKKRIKNPSDKKINKNDNVTQENKSKLNFKPVKVKVIGHGNDDNSNKLKNSKDESQKNSLKILNIIKDTNRNENIDYTKYLSITQSKNYKNNNKNKNNNNEKANKLCSEGKNSARDNISHFHIQKLNPNLLLFQNTAILNQRISKQDRPINVHRPFTNYFFSKKIKSKFSNFLRSSEMQINNQHYNLGIKKDFYQKITKKRKKLMLYDILSTSNATFSKKHLIQYLIRSLSQNSCISKYLEI